MQKIKFCTMMKNTNEILNIISNIKKLYKYINILYKYI